MSNYQLSRRQLVTTSVIMSAVYFISAVGVWSLQQSKFESSADNVVPPTSYTVSPTTGQAPLTVTVEYPNFTGFVPKGGRAVDWGDGSPAITIVGATGRISHVYTVSGSYKVNLQQCIEVCRKNDRSTVLATVTVQNPGPSPTAILQGPVSVTKGSTVVYAPTGTAGSGTLTSLKVYRSPKQIPNSWVELTPLACVGVTCQSLTWDTSTEVIGDYYLVVNVANSLGQQCSGNAPGGTKDLWGNTLTSWSDCGSGSRLSVNLGTTTIVTTTPTSSPSTPSIDSSTSPAPTTSTTLPQPTSAPTPTPLGTTMPPLASLPTTTTTVAQAEATNRGAITPKSFQLVATGGSLLFNLAVALLLSLLTTLFFLRRHGGDEGNDEDMQK